MSAQTYRPIIDGLRAVAVIAVILNHLDTRWCPGGYLGVDVFFVISGFVVTQSLALRGAAPGAWRTLVLGFYARRVNRLFPNLILCVLVSAFGIAILSPEPQVSLRTGMAALFGVSNLYLQHAALDYFAPAAAANAYTQTWSLGVEEQFYLALPLLWLASRLPLRGIGAHGPLLVAVAAALSLAWDFHQTASAPTQAYFAASTRIWELAAGCLLASRPLAPHGSFRPSIPLVVPALLLLAGMFVLAPALHAVLAKLVTVACALALIHEAVAERPDSRALAFLGHRSMVGIGRLSYSLYLWHWPVICLMRWAGWQGPQAAALEVALMLPIAGAAYHWVERPLRKAGVGWRDSDRFRLGWACAIGAALVLNTVERNSPAFYVFSTDTRRPSASFGDRPAGGRYAEHSCELLGNRPLPVPATHVLADCTAPPGAGRHQTLWMMGDSHAGHYRALLARLHAELGLGTYLVTTLGMPFPVPADEPDFAANILFSEIRQRWRPGDIVIVSRLYLNREDSAHPPKPDFDRWLPQVGALADQLEQEGVHLLVVGPTPMFEFVNLDLCARQGPQSDVCAVERKRLAEPIGQIYQDLSTAARAHPNLRIFDPWRELCPASALQCSPWVAGQLAFHDRDHLSAWGAESLAPAFRRTLEELRWISAAAPGSAAGE